MAIDKIKNREKKIKEFILSKLSLKDSIGKTMNNKSNTKNNIGNVDIIMYL